MKSRIARTLLAIVVLGLSLQTRLPAARVGRIITVAAGTPVQLATQSTLVRRIFIQMQAGGTGMGYVMDGVTVGTTPVANTNPTVQLAAATASAPGGNYSDASQTSAYDIDLQKIWIDGSHTGDTILVSYETAK